MINDVISFAKMQFGLLRTLSNCLEISFPEIISLQPELEPVCNKENIIMGYAVSFGSYLSVDIIKKLKGLCPDGKVYLNFYVVNDMPIPEVKITSYYIPYFIPQENAECNN